MSNEKTTMSLVTEVGTFGSIDMKDPTVTPVEELARTTTDKHLKHYLEENMKTEVTNK